MSLYDLNSYCAKIKKPHMILIQNKKNIFFVAWFFFGKYYLIIFLTLNNTYLFTLLKTIYIFALQLGTINKIIFFCLISKYLKSFIEYYYTK